MIWPAHRAHSFGIGGAELTVYHPIHTIITPPTGDGLAVSVAEARAHMGYGDEVDAALDAEVEAFIRAAQSAVESYCVDLTLLATVWRADLPLLGEETLLRKRPYAGSPSIEYVKAADGEITTVASTVYHVIAAEQFRARVYLGADQAWPTDPATRRDAFRITYTAGWTVETLPYDLRSAILMMAAKLNASRGDCEDGGGATASVYALKNSNASALPPAAAALLDPYKLREVWAA